MVRPQRQRLHARSALTKEDDDAGDRRTRWCWLRHRESKSSNRAAAEEQFRVQSSLERVRAHRRVRQVMSAKRRRCLTMATSVVRLSAPAAARQSSFAVGAPSALCARPAGAGNACRSAVVAMAKKGKDIRLMITLECTEQKATGVAGISRYTSEKVSEWPSPRDAAEAACCRLATLRGEARLQPGSAGRNASRAVGVCRWLSRSAAVRALRPPTPPVRALAAQPAARRRRSRVWAEPPQHARPY